MMRALLLGLIGMSTGCLGGSSTPAPKASSAAAPSKPETGGTRSESPANSDRKAPTDTKSTIAPADSKASPAVDVVDSTTSDTASGDRSSGPAPAEPPKPNGPAALTDLVADLGLLDSTTIRCSDAQVSCEAPWAQTEDLSGCSLREGDALHVIAPDGVRVRTVDAPEKYSIVLVADPVATPFDIGLATKDHGPSPDARLVERWLTTPGRDAKSLARWVKKKRKGRTFIPVGEVKGTFGGGIDRILVLRPKPLKRSAEEEAEDPDLTGEAALLIAGTEPRGFLPFDKELSYDDFGLGGGEDEGEDEETWTEGVLGLQVAGVVDLDGDGVEEILWANQPSIPQLVTQAHLSFFAKGEHRLQELWSCSYCGCEALLPEEHCRGAVKFPKKKARR